MLIPTINPRFIPTILMLTLINLVSCTEEYDECFYLTDEIVTKVYQLDHFTQIETFVPGEYTFKQGKNHQIEITGNPRYLDSLNNYVNYETLSISNRFPFCENKAQLKIEITAPKIKDLFIDAESKVTIKDFVNQDDLNINLSKKSFLEINRFQGMRKFFMLLREDAIIKANTPLEEIDSLQVNIEGDGRFNGYNVPAKNVDVNILGKGYCEVNAIKKLHVVIKGDANVVSKGMPSLYKSITGRGDVYFKD